jgi:hypothetical protein
MRVPKVQVYHNDLQMDSNLRKVYGFDHEYGQNWSPRVIAILNYEKC